MDRTLACPMCQGGIFADDAFCSWCGTGIRPREGATGSTRRALAAVEDPASERRVCWSCNTALVSSDLFCSTCGARYGLHEVPAEPADHPLELVPRALVDQSRGKYEFLGELGRGGMGVVYLARDLVLGRMVAIKVLSRAWVTEGSMLERFQREARTIASVRHDSIVSIHDVGRADDLPYFVMDYIEGSSLSSVLRHHGRLSIAAARRILFDVGSALSYAHRRGIVHRDVKPSNVMLDHDGKAVVMDFGIAKVSERSGDLTRTGLLMGTPEYMSPEQCRGHVVTPESDQYSLGVVAYAMLTGSPPFTGPFYQVLMAHQNDAPPSLAELRPDCPASMAHALERMLSKAPAGRWPGITEALLAMALDPPAINDPAKSEVVELIRDVERVRKQPPRYEGGPPSPGTEEAPTWMRIAPGPGELEAGDRIRLSASLVFANGEEANGPDVSWESTDPAVAWVDPTTGELVAVGSGSTIVRARSGQLEESLAIHVSAPRVASMTVSPDNVGLAVGESITLRAQTSGKRGDLLERSVSWSSTNPSVARVSDQGTVEAHARGSAIILAHCEGVGAACGVHVPGTETLEPVSPRGETNERPRRARLLVIGGFFAVALSLLWRYPPFRAARDLTRFEIVEAGSDRAVTDALPLMVGDSLQLYTRNADDGRGSESVSWRSSDPAVGLVSPTGMLHARAPGSARVTASVVARSAEIEVTVVDRAVRLEITTASGDSVRSSLTVDNRDTISLLAAVRGVAGSLMREPVVWSSSDSSIIRISGAGDLLAYSPGRTTIVAEAAGLKRDIEVTVTASRTGPAKPARPAGEDGPVRGAPAIDGRLELVIVPWADVYVDGELLVRRRPTVGLSLSPGPHRLRLVNPNFGTIDTTLIVPAGRAVRHTIQMKRGAQR